MKRLNLLVVIVCVGTTTLFGQIRVDGNGKAYFGTNSSSGYGTVNITTDGVNGGLSLTGTSGSIFRFFKSGTNAYIARGTSLYNGMRISDSGNISI